jgi:hypothetical protein
MRFVRTYWKRVVTAFLALIIVAGMVFYVWASTPVGELMPAAQQELESSETVNVTYDEWLVFSPQEGAPKTGFIFYPGGRVLADAYAPLGQSLAEQGYLAVFVPMPLNLAILNVDGANAVIEAYPEVNHWVIGGHSLGGAMAARYVYNNPDAVDGLVMMAAFPETQFDFSERDLVIASIYGSLDGLATVEEVEAAEPLLPEDAIFLLIEGGNHAQFGWYGAQAGDNEATISREEQFGQIVSGTLGVLERVSQ